MGDVIAGYFSDILIRCSIPLMEVVSSSPFCSISFSSVVPSLLADLVSVVSCETPDPFF